MPTSNKFIAEPKGFKHKLIAISIISFSMLICWGFISELVVVNDNYVKLMNKAIFIEVWSLTFSVPFLLGIMGLVIMISYLKLVGRMTVITLHNGFKLLCLFAVLGIIAGIIFAYLSSNFLEDKGYSYCSTYTEHRAGTPNIWVKKPGYCINNGTLVSTEILEWVASQEAQGNHPSTAEVKVTIFKMVESYKSNFPNIYSKR